MQGLWQTERVLSILALKWKMKLVIGTSPHVILEFLANNKLTSLNVHRRIPHEAVMIESRHCSMNRSSPCLGHETQKA